MAVRNLNHLTGHDRRRWVAELPVTCWRVASWLVGAGRQLVDFGFLLRRSDARGTRGIVTVSKVLADGRPCTTFGPRPFLSHHVEDRLLPLKQTVRHRVNVTRTGRTSVLIAGSPAECGVSRSDSRCRRRSALRCSLPTRSSVR